jgi:hypothetical protein
MEHGQALWLAALGYLVTAEVVARTLARKDSRRFPYRRGEQQCFEAGLHEFAHHYEHRNRGVNFTLAEHGPLWDPPTPGAPNHSHWVNLRALGGSIERVVRSAQKAHLEGEVVLVRNPTDVVAGGFVISPLDPR